MRSPGTIIIAVKIPEKAPAQNNCGGDKFSLLLPVEENSCLPSPNPKKLIAKIGATPVIGAAIPTKISQINIKQYMKTVEKCKKNT